MKDTVELAMTIRDELDPVQDRCARLGWLLHDIEVALNDGEARPGEHQTEIELGLELARELTCAMRRGLTDMEAACARVLGDDLDVAA